jgi:hypothetical protein
LSTVLAVALGCVAVLVAAAAFPVARRMLLQRPVGTFTCSVRLGGATSRKGFSYGVARYHGDRVEWFEIFSFSPRPRHVFRRRDLQLRARRPARAEEVHGLPASTMVLECALAGTPLELAMTPDALTGFMAWVEAAPPGQHMPA